MIWWFSGTGNSWEVAQRATDVLNCPLRAMAAEVGTDAQLAVDGCNEIGFVFPVYGWDIPKAVNAFLAQLPPYPTAAAPHVFAILTCGDDIGHTDKQLRKALARKGWPLHAVYSLRMRNTYVCLPGFDKDSTEVETAKHAEAMSVLTGSIIPRIRRHEGSTAADIHPGAFAWAKTHVLGVLFNKLLTTPRPFRADAACTSCGTCARCCPLGNISIKKGKGNKPAWGTHCTLCLACYHSCPHHAVEYGRFTKGKGQVKVTARRF